MKDIYTGADFCPKHLIQFLNTIDRCIRVEGDKLRLVTIKESRGYRSSGVLVNLLESFLKQKTQKGVS